MVLSINFKFLYFYIINNQFNEKVRINIWNDNIHIFNECTKKGKAYIIPMGNGVYQSSITGRSGFSSTAKLKTKALEKGREFAKEKKAEIEVIGFDTVEQSFMVFPQAIMTFRLVYETVEINDPNDPNTITIRTTGNYKNNNQQTTITKPSSQIQNKDQKDAAMKEVKRLKELLDL